MPEIIFIWIKLKKAVAKIVIIQYTATKFTSPYIV